MAHNANIILVNSLARLNIKEISFIIEIRVVLAQISKIKEKQIQGKDNTKSTLYQLFGQLSDKKIFCLLHKQLGIDRYVKKLTTEKLLFLIVLAQLKQHKGLREISTSIGDDAVSRAIGLESISFSQISRRLASLPTEAFEVLFKHVVSKSIAKMGLQAVERNLNRLNLIDSSTISLSLTRYPWAVFRKTKSGIKLHLRVRVLEEGVLPDEIVITPAKPADRTQMDALVAEDPNAINVFDRGYIDYSKSLPTAKKVYALSPG